MEAEEGYKSSKFNAGVLQTNRVHQIQDKINYYSQNLEAFDPQVGKFHYDIVFTLIGVLFKEVRPKLTKTEQLKGDYTRDGLKIFMELHPIHINKKRISTGDSNWELQSTEWKVFQRELTKYNDLVMDFLEDHQMNSPNRDEDDDDEL